MGARSGGDPVSEGAASLLECLGAERTYIAATGLLLRGVKREEVVRGQVVTVPGAVRPHLRGEAELYVLTAAEGGRHTPFATGYTPQFFFGATDVTGSVTMPDDGVVEPGARACVRFSRATRTDRCRQTRVVSMMMR